MRLVRYLLVYLAILFFGAAMLSPWLYVLGQWAAEHWPVLEKLSAQPFHRYVDRCLLALAMIGMWLLLRGIGASSWGAVGVVKPAGNGGRVAAGFALGFASLAGVAALALLAGARTVKGDLSASALFSRMISAGGTAVLVAAMEELLFRGALFGALRRAHRWTTALVVSSAVYALAHFFQKPPDPPRITWTSGFEILAKMCHGFLDFEMLVPGFFTLLLAGIILGLAYQRTGNLYFSAGLHAGWIFWLKFYGALTLPAASASQWFWGTGKLVDGWLALALLLPVLWAVWRIPQAANCVTGAECNQTSAATEPPRTKPYAA